MTVDEFGKAVVASGLMPAPDLKALWAALPADARPKSDQAFAKLLIERRKITPFHAEEILAGKGTPLVLGDYVLLGRIGAGGMGQVFKAEHRRMKRIVALKVLPAAMTKDEPAIRRFMREVEAAAKLSHPNIVAAFDAGAQRGVHYLVMEHVEGHDLAAVVKRAGKLTVNQVTDYILQAARGLAYAHGEGVIHRDIKPANLLLDKKGVVKILDMGLARFEALEGSEGAAQEGLTQSGQVMGTVDFMAPEQAFDTRHADARADIYSLGCSMYRLLINENVYGGESLVQKLMAHREKPIPDLCKLRADVPPAVDAVFRKMMAKNPADRYQHAADLVAELEACRNSGVTASFASPGLSQPAFPSAAGTPSGSSAPGLASAIKGNDELTTALGNCLLQGTAPPEQTVTNAAHAAETDPKSELGLGSRRKRQAAGGRKKPPLVLIVAGGAGALLVLLLGIWIIVRDKDGKEVGRVEFPAGGKVEMANDPPPAAKETAPKQEPAKGTSKAFSTTPFQRWMKDVAAMPAEKQIEAVSKKLMELNPGFDGEVSNASGKGIPRIENGVVTAFMFLCDDVTDISPVRGLAGLNTLNCPSSGAGKGKLSDLSPLQGMKLKSLSFYGTQVSNLSPLHGMPLRFLTFHRTLVSDLSPLRGMNITSLVCDNTPVADLTPLEECKSLATLRVNRTNVSPASVTALQKALPDCKIEWDDPAQLARPAAPASGTAKPVIPPGAGVRRANEGIAKTARPSPQVPATLAPPANPGQLAKLPIVGPVDAKAEILPGLISRPGKIQGLGRWQVETARPRCAFPGIHSVAWHPTKPLLACSDGGRVLRIYDTKTWQLTRILVGHKFEIRSLAWSSDGKWLASRSGGEIRFWPNGESAGPVMKFAGDALAWQPDGKWLAVSNGNNIRLITPENEQGPVLTGHTGVVRGLAWSSDGQRLASCSFNDMTVRTWKPDGTAEMKLKGHEGPVWCVSWSRTGNLASCSDDKTLRIWNADGTPGPILRDFITASYNTKLIWSPDGKYLLSGLGNNKAQLSLADGSVLRELKTPGYKTSFAWSPDSSTIVMGDSEGRLTCVSPEGKELPGLENKGHAFGCVALSPDGETVLAGGDDGLVRRWNGGGVASQAVKAATYTVGSVAWSPDGSHFAASEAGGGGGANIRVFDKNAQVTQVFSSPAGTSSVCWSPDSRHLASGHHDKILRLWELGRTEPTELTGHKSEVLAVNWSPDGEQILSRDKDSIRLWKSDGKLNSEVEFAYGNGRWAAWSASGKRFAALGKTMSVMLWNADATAFKTLSVPANADEALRGSCYALAWSPDEQHVLVGNDWGSVPIWQISDGKLERVLRWSAETIMAADWGSRLALASRNRTLNVLDGVTLEPQWSAVILPDGQSVSFSAAGQIIDGDPALIEKELVYLVEGSDSRVDILKPSEFVARVKKLAGK